MKLVAIGCVIFFILVCSSVTSADSKGDQYSDIIWKYSFKKCRNNGMVLHPNPALGKVWRCNCLPKYLRTRMNCIQTSHVSKGINHNDRNIYSYAKKNCGANYMVDHPNPELGKVMKCECLPPIVRQRMTCIQSPPELEQETSAEFIKRYAMEHCGNDGTVDHPNKELGKAMICECLPPSIRDTMNCISHSVNPSNDSEDSFVSSFIEAKCGNDSMTDHPNPLIGRVVRCECLPFNYSNKMNCIEGKPSDSHESQSEIIRKYAMEHCGNDGSVNHPNQQLGRVMRCNCVPPQLRYTVNCLQDLFDI